MEKRQTDIPLSDVRETIGFIIGVWCIPLRSPLASILQSRLRLALGFHNDVQFFGPDTDEHNDRSRYIEFALPATDPLSRSSCPPQSLYLTDHTIPALCAIPSRFRTRTVFSKSFQQDLSRTATSLKRV